MSRLQDATAYVVGLAIMFSPTALAIFASAMLSKRSKEEWKLLAWVPSLPLVGWWLYIFALVAGDGPGNLWPLTMAIPAIATAVLFALFLIARKLVGSGPPRRPWQH